jgi:urease accessory protein
MGLLENIPAKLPLAQRAEGSVRLSVDAPARLRRLYQQGSAKARFSACEDDAREIVLINTAGGMTGGDRFAWAIEAGPGARCRAVTQACEKVYRSAGGDVEVRVELTVAKDASLEWLPQETILFDGSRLRRRFDIEVAGGGRLLAVESALLGRRAMGETDARVWLKDRWRVRREGRLAFADDLLCDDPLSREPRPAILGGATALASLLLVSEDAEAGLEPLRAAIGSAGAASAFDGKLFCRILAADGLALRRALVPAIAALRHGRPTPRLWTV